MNDCKKQTIKTHKIHFYGVGSPFGADQIGQIVLEKLQLKLSSYQIKYPYDIYYDVGSGFQLLEYMRDTKELHIIDAMVSGQPPGTLHHFPATKLTADYNPLLSTHGCYLADIIELGRILAYIPEYTFFHGVEITPNNELTDDLMQACEILAEEILQKIF